MKMLKKIGWWSFALLSTLIGLYPIMYFIIDRHFGLLSSKTPELLQDALWNTGFYGHILFGGLALLTGWSQFSQKLRKKRVDLHRTLGKVYLISVLISGTCGIYVGVYATGGIVSSSGFILLGLIWVFSSARAYKAIRVRKLDLHADLMLISYAACFAAVTLRIWLPILTSITGEFIIAYRIVAWLCWVPNLLAVSIYLFRKRKLSSVRLEV